MNTNFLPTTALFLATIVSCLAGPPDPKDMKGMAPAMVAESDAGPYVAIYGGANVSQNYGNARADFTGAPGTFVYRGDATDKVGGVGGLKGGYNFNSFAIGGDFRLQLAAELDAYYLGTRTDVHSRFNPGADFDLRGNMNNAAFMLNGLVRLKTGTFFTPYIGAGIGTEYLTFTRPTVTQQGVGSFPAEHNANAFAGAVQAVGGFDFEIAKHWDLFTEYKYLVAIDPSLDFGNVGFGGAASFNTKLDPYELAQHLVTAGVKYNF